MTKGGKKKVREHIDDKILRLFKENTYKDKSCPKNITLELLAEAMGSSRDAQIHIKNKNKEALWFAYYQTMLFNIDAPKVESFNFNKKITISKNNKTTNFLKF